MFNSICAGVTELVGYFLGTSLKSHGIASLAMAFQGRFLA
jgi:hypothetical protein